MEKRTRKNPTNYLMSLFSNPVTLLWLGGLLAMIIASLVPQGGLSEMETGFARDKVVRVITFLLLSFYPVAFFPSIRMGLIISTFIAPLGFLLEIFQKYVPGRNFSPEDMIANNIGAIIGIFLAIAIRFYFRTGQLNFRKKDGHTPRAALATEKDISKSRDNETKENSDHQPSRKEEKRGSLRFKEWRSKAIILGLLVVLGYVGWVMITGHTRRKNPTQKSQPELKTLSEQAVIRAEIVPDMIKPDITEPREEKTAAEDMALYNSVFPDPAIVTVAGSEPEPKVPTSEPDGMDKTESGITPARPMPQNAGIPPDKRPDPAEKAVTTKPVFSIRAGAFLEKQNAEKLVADLELKGFHPYIFKATDNKNRTWYAVQLSDHANLDQATTAAAIFRNKEKKKVYITHKNSLKTIPGLPTR